MNFFAQYTKDFYTCNNYVNIHAGYSNLHTRIWRSELRNGYIYLQFIIVYRVIADQDMFGIIKNSHTISRMFSRIYLDCAIWCEVWNRVWLYTRFCIYDRAMRVFSSAEYIRIFRICWISQQTYSFAIMNAHIFVIVNHKTWQYMHKTEHCDTVFRRKW